MAEDCPLCQLRMNKITEWYWLDPVVIACDCATCTPNGTPDHIMVVLRRHTEEPTEQEARHMQGIADRLGLEVTRKQAQQIKEHAHWHCQQRHP